MPNDPRIDKPLDCNGEPIWVGDVVRLVFPVSKDAHNEFVICRLIIESENTTVVMKPTLQEFPVKKATTLNPGFICIDVRYRTTFYQLERIEPNDTTQD